MKRDIELIRQIVLQIESMATGYVFEKLTVDGCSDEQIGYHSYLIADAGLAKGLDQTGIDAKSPYWHILHLTSAGHDFADAVRNDSTWKKATGIVKEKAGGATVEILKEVLTRMVKDTLGLP